VRNDSSSNRLAAQTAPVSITSVELTIECCSVTSDYLTGDSASVFFSALYQFLIAFYSLANEV
jgi:hypothetical protein